MVVGRERTQLAIDEVQIAIDGERDREEGKQKMENLAKGHRGDR